MIQKQIYLKERQQAAIREIAEARGISEAEVIRNAAEVTNFPKIYQCAFMYAISAAKTKLAARATAFHRNLQKACLCLVIFPSKERNLRPML